MRRVFVDTSVLFPFSVMDLFLALTENGLHEMLWSDELLEEWKHVIVREQRRSAESAASITAAIREFFGDLRIAPDTYRDMIDTMPGADPDDHVHTAAAIAGGADTLVTRDTTGFPAGPLADLGLTVLDPDTYLIDLFEEYPDDVTATVVELARSKTRPPMMANDLLATLERAGLATFPALVSANL